MRFFVPTVDQMITVTFPGEMLRCSVTKLLDYKTCFVKLDTTPLNPAKQHAYRLGDVVAVRLVQSELGPVWQAIDDRVLFARKAEVTEPPLPEKRVSTRKRAAVRKRAKGGKSAVVRK